MRYLLAGCMAAGMLGYANDSISGPVLGYAKRGGGLKAVLGIPGAAYFGSDADVSGLELAAFSSERAYALALTSDGRSIRIFALRARTAVPSDNIPAADTPIRAVRLSPAGTAAVLIRDEAIDVITGLPAAATKKLQVAKPNDTRTVAVSDDGEAVAIVDGTGAAWLMKGADKRQIAAANVTDINFRAATHDLIYVDGDAVFTESAAGTAVVAGPADGLSAPRIGGFSPRGNLIAVLNGDGKELLINGIRSTSAARISLPCEVSDLEWVQDATLRLSCQSNGAVHLLHVSDSAVRVFFVPEPVQ
jgi:hypothetical protein